MDVAGADAVLMLFVGDSIGLPLFEHARQTLKTEFSTLIFFMASAVCFPHNSQKETIFVYLYSNLLVFSILIVFFPPSLLLLKDTFGF